MTKRPIPPPTLRESDQKQVELKHGAGVPVALDHDEAPEELPLDDTGFYDSYASFARSLRTWFIAYGIGGPVILLSNAAVFASVKTSGYLPAIGICFLIGVMLQILEAVVYKFAMWQLYLTELDPRLKSAWPYKLANFIANCTPLELLVDILTILAFCTSTSLMLYVVAR